MGLVSSVIVVAVALYLMIEIELNPRDAPGTFHARMIPTLVGAALAMIGALSGRIMFLLLGFCVGFFWYWIGLYLLFVPGVAKAIGIGEIGYVVAAWLIARAPDRWTSASSREPR